MYWPPLPPENQEFTLILNYVRGRVDPRAIVRPEGLSQQEIPVTPYGNLNIETVHIFLLEGKITAISPTPASNPIGTHELKSHEAFHYSVFFNLLSAPCSQTFRHFGLRSSGVLRVIGWLSIYHA